VKPYGIYGRPFDVDPAGELGRKISLATTPAEARLLKTITGHAISTWFGDWSGDVRQAVARTVAGANGRKSVASLVMYNIPHRDCGDYSKNSVSSAQVYKTWVDRFIAGLGKSREIIIIEPDALALTTCLTPAQSAERSALLKYAVTRVAAQGSWSYIDAGHTEWLTASVIADRLKAAGIAEATGFSLNVSNFKATGHTVSYGVSISNLIGHKHFLVDTSRNGTPLTNNLWCNPPGMTLGIEPTTHTSSSLVDAYLWIKPPGESDGPCNGGPGPGEFFTSYALALVTGAKS